MYIPVILGTARKGRYSEKVANFVLGEVKKAKIKTALVDVRNYRIKATDNTEKIAPAKKFEKMLKKADGLIIVSPEYNHSYPGELKMFLDMLFEQYYMKPFGICGVSNGNFGGARMVEQFMQLAANFRMVPAGVMYFPFVEELFDKNNKIKDEKYYKRAKRFLEELKKTIKPVKKSVKRK